VRLFLSRARERTIYNQVNRNPPSRFLKEIPARLLDETGSGRRVEAFGRREGQLPQAGNRGNTGRIRTARPALPIGQIGKPKLTFQGKNLDQIPGVTKGFTPSIARSVEESAMNRLFKPGERVLHRKFGAGRVREITGSGSDARISIEFTAYGVKEFSLSIAPIVKLDD